MKYRTLDGNRDYTLGKNLFLKDREAVAQAIQTKLLLLLGEWWENTELGTPWFEKVLGLYGAASEKTQAVDLVISNRILETDHVSRIVSYHSSIAGREYRAEITVETEYGSVGITIGDNRLEVGI